MRTISALTLLAAMFGLLAIGCGGGEEAANPAQVSDHLVRLHKAFYIDQDAFDRGEDDPNMMISEKFDTTIWVQFWPTPKFSLYANGGDYYVDVLVDSRGVACNAVEGPEWFEVESVPANAAVPTRIKLSQVDELNQIYCTAPDSAQLHISLAGPDSVMGYVAEPIYLADSNMIAFEVQTLHMMPTGGWDVEGVVQIDEELNVVSWVVDTEAPEETDAVSQALSPALGLLTFKPMDTAFSMAILDGVYDVVMTQDSIYFDPEHVTDFIINPLVIPRQ